MHRSTILQSHRNHITDENSRNVLKKPSTKSSAALSNITNTSAPEYKGKKPGLVPLKKRSSKTKSSSISSRTRKRKQKTIEIEDGFYDDDLMVIEEEEPTYENIDLGYEDNPLNATIYVNDIMDHCFKTEERFMADPNYMEEQEEILPRMRRILVDWLVEVHLKFTLLPETLYLTVNLIDRFLERRNVEKSYLQLVGMTCLFIASKYEEIYPPECNDFVYISAETYSRNEIFEMEQLILNTLGFDITTPTSLYFLRRFSKASGSDYNAHGLCKYQLELALLDTEMLKYKPSQIAAASCLVTRTILGQEWNNTMIHYTRYEKTELYECARDLIKLIKSAPHSSKQSVYKKYSLTKFHGVANFEIDDSVIDRLY